MTLAIVAIAAVTVLLSTLFICSAIMTRSTTPCLFGDRVVLSGAYRYDGGKCSGKPENVYASNGKLDGVRVCNGHVKQLLDLADHLAK